MTKAISKYLALYAEPEIELAQDLQGNYQHVLVIPAFREDIDLLDGVRPALSAGATEARTLVILVVNASAGAPADAREANRRLLDGLKAARGPGREFGRGAFLQRAEGLDVLALDRSSPGRELPAKQGVGLARKIGCDLSLALHVRGSVASSWIHTTDADAVQPSDRFDVADRMGEKPATGTEPGPVAIAFPFVHETSGDRERDEAVSLYEISLRYYVLGLLWAGSPYGFHTVGSTLAFRAEPYAQVRGFPKRLAGEDFYLMEKLSKLGAVLQPECRPVQLRGRGSDRVPFGTGPAVSRIHAERARGEPFRMYHPESFAVLKGWLVVLDRFAGGEPLAGLIDGWTSTLGKSARAAAASTLQGLGAPQALARLREEGHPLRHAVPTWFDGFRTLKFLHGLRDRGFPKLPWREALGAAPFLAGLTGHSITELAQEMTARDSGSRRAGRV